MNYWERLRVNGEKYKGIQVSTSIRLPPEDLIKAVGAKHLRELGYPSDLKECLRDILENLHRMKGLKYCTHDASKHEIFRLEGDESSMIQISSRGTIIITARSPDSLIRIHRMLLEALWLSGYSSDVLEPMRAKISRIEKYEVRSPEDIKSLFRYQAIVGVRK
jgi:hypothetical protein